MSRADARANRERIAEAAREVLAADPRASMAEIAQRAGLSRVTLYGHAGNRAELMARVVADHAEAALGSLRTCLAEPITTDLLREVVQDSWRTLLDSSTLMVEAEAELGADRVRRFHQPLIDELAAWFRAGREVGALTSDQDPAWLAHAYYALVRAAVSVAEIDSAVVDPEEALRNSVTVLLELRR